MGLRDAFKARLDTELHRCVPRECNSATASGVHATAGATPLQPLAHLHRATAATNNATAVQPDGPTAVASGLKPATGPTTVATAVRQRPYRLSERDARAAHLVPWDDAACKRFMGRVDLLHRVGVSGVDAEDLAERFHLRDVERDDRTTCLECKHYRPGRCWNARMAGLGSSDLGRDLAGRLQRCPGYTPTPRALALLEQEESRSGALSSEHP